MLGLHACFRFFRWTLGAATEFALSGSHTLNILLYDDLLGGKIVHGKHKIVCIGFTEVGKKMIFGFVETCTENYRYET